MKRTTKLLSALVFTLCMECGNYTKKDTTPKDNITQEETLNVKYLEKGFEIYKKNKSKTKLYSRFIGEHYNSLLVFENRSKTDYSWTEFRNNKLNCTDKCQFELGEFAGYYDSKTGACYNTAPKRCTEPQIKEMYKKTYGILNKLNFNNALFKWAELIERQ